MARGLDKRQAICGSGEESRQYFSTNEEREVSILINLNNLVYTLFLLVSLTYNHTHLPTHTQVLMIVVVCLMGSTITLSLDRAISRPTGPLDALPDI